MQWGLAGDIPVTGDFDGSGKSEIAVWRPSEGNWYVVSGRDGSTFTQQWGLQGDIPYAADFDGDTTTDFAVWRPSDQHLYVRPSSGAAEYSLQAPPPDKLVDSTKFEVGPPGVQGSLGKGVFVLQLGDFDHDGKPDFALFDEGLNSNATDLNAGNWYIIGSANPTSPITQHWGNQGDLPVAGDYDGDGQTDYAIWRPSTGTWWVIPSANPTQGYFRQWGLPNDIPQVGDFDGDGKVDLVVWRPSNAVWYCILSRAGQVIAPFGLPGDVPVASDYTGSRSSQVAVWRPSNGTWYISQGTNPPSTQQWGLPGDLPVVGDINGDGVADYNVWRPTEARYYFLFNAQPQTRTGAELGLAGDSFVFNEPPVTPFVGPR
jgi:hypothetical protein